MNTTRKQMLGIVAIAASGIVAFIAPFLLHSPPLQASTPGPGSGNSGGDNPGTSGTPGQGHGKKSWKDLVDAMGLCGENHGAKMSVLAKANRAMHAGNSTRTDHAIRQLEHKLNTPSAEKHYGSCLGQLKDIVDDLASS